MVSVTALFVATWYLAKKVGRTVICMGKIKYIKCPRCELNYIPDTEEMCDICKAELGLETDIVLLDDIIDDEEPLKLCPICKTAYIGLDEDTR